MTVNKMKSENKMNLKITSCEDIAVFSVQIIDGGGQGRHEDLQLSAEFELEGFLIGMVGKGRLRREGLSTPVVLPGKSHGQRSQAATIQGVTKSRTQLSTHTHKAQYT